MNCKTCNGTGRYDTFVECFRPASNCCGGCYKEVDCEICHGKGYLVSDYDDEFANTVEILIERFRIRVILFKGHVANYLKVGNIELSNKYANRVETCENAILRLETVLYNHIEKRRL